MDRLSVHDAKARFSELVQRAQGGGPTAITKQGRIVAGIMPANESAWDRSAVLEEAESLRPTPPVGSIATCTRHA